jgi:hypothetical protein
MSLAAALQDLIFETLSTDATLIGLVGSKIYDNPAREAGYPRICFGPTQEVSDDADGFAGEEHSFQIDVWTQENGSQRGAKVICDAVKQALHLKELSLPDPYALTELRVQSKHVMDDPDEKVAHGVVSVVALLEKTDAFD